MFGFPGELEASFLKAWQEPFTGFELRWVEVEICRQAMVPSNITELFDAMKEKFPDIQNMHQSKFYRTVNSLEEAGYLKSETHGRAKIIETTADGAKELGRITRYFFEIQMDQMKVAIWQDVIEKITQPLGCLLDDKNIVVFSPEYETINKVISNCNRCASRKKPFNRQELHELHQNFAFINYHAFTYGRTELSRLETLEELDKWPYRENYTSRVILFTALSSFSKDAVSILKEAKRILSPDGKIIIFELSSKDSKLLTTIMRQATMLINFTYTRNEWKISDDLPENRQIVKWIEEAGLTIDHQFPDVVSSVYIVS